MDPRHNKTRAAMMLSIFGSLIWSSVNYPAPLMMITENSLILSVIIFGLGISIISKSRKLSALKLIAGVICLVFLSLLMNIMLTGLGMVIFKAEASTVKFLFVQISANLLTIITYASGFAQYAENNVSPPDPLPVSEHYELAKAVLFVLFILLAGICISVFMAPHPSRDSITLVKIISCLISMASLMCILLKPEKNK